MDIYLFALFILFGLAIFDLIVGVSNDAVNFLNSSIGSKVAPNHVIMIIAGLGMLCGVTFSSGMMEVARKGIFHPQFFLMPELVTIFIAVMLTDVLLLDLFNTFGLPTSTTVSIVFELLGAAVAVSLIKIYASDDSYAMLAQYINTAKALEIIMGILLAVVVAFFFGALVQFITRLFFTFDYKPKLKRYGGIWGGVALSAITYFILIKGSKGASFLPPGAVLWIKNHAWIIFTGSFMIFGIIFQLLAMFTKINILKPVVLVGTFALAMAFAANDLVNFIGVPLAGMNAYQVASLGNDPLTTSMAALQGAVKTNTFLLLIAGTIMMATLWISKKARTVTDTSVNLGRQDEGTERFGSSALSRGIVRMVYSQFVVIRNIIPSPVRRFISNRLDPENCKPVPAYDGTIPSFDLIRASVNLMVAAAIVSYATSYTLPLSTTYVTFMVAMGASLADQAWGRESAVYRVTGVLAVIGGWFITALAAFTVSLIFASAISYFKFPAIIALLFLVVILIVRSSIVHVKRKKETESIESFSLKDTDDPDEAIRISFEQTGLYLKKVSDTLVICFENTLSGNQQKLKLIREETNKIQIWSNIMIVNIFKALSLLHDKDVDNARKYSRTIRSLQDITESHRDIIIRAHEHFSNNHSGFTEEQKDELQQIKTSISRLLWNTGIMLLRKKKADDNYITNQSRRLEELADRFNRNQILRIQKAESKTRLSILYYAFLENSLKISEQTRNLLDIFKDSFEQYDHIE